MQNSNLGKTMENSRLPVITRLPPEMYARFIQILRRSLPPPLTDAPEDLVRRDDDAIAEFTSLRPANAEEANLAAMFVLASAHAMHSLQSISEDGADAFKCQATFIKMTRQALSNRSLLLKLQTAREKIEESMARAAADRQTREAVLYNLMIARREALARSTAASEPARTVQLSRLPDALPPARSPQIQPPAEAVPPARLEFQFGPSSQSTEDETSVTPGKRVLH